MAFPNEDPSAVVLRYRRLWLAIGVAMIAVVIFQSLTPAPIQIPLENGDKYGHALTYATLMFWFALIYARPGARALWAVAFVLMGMALEGLQGLTDYRTFEWEDAAANTLGVCLGWLFAPPRVPHALRFVENYMMRRA